MLLDFRFSGELSELRMVNEFVQRNDKRADEVALNLNDRLILFSKKIELSKRLAWLLVFFFYFEMKRNVVLKLDCQHEMVITD